MIKKDYKYLLNKPQKEPFLTDFNIGVLFGAVFTIYSYWFLTSL